MKLYVKKKVKKQKNRSTINKQMLFGQHAQNKNFKFSINKVEVLNKLVQTKNQYGCSLVKTKSTNRSYLYGSRFKQTILNLEQTVINLRKVFSLVKSLLNSPSSKSENTKILLVCNKVQFRIFNRIIGKNVLWRERFLLRTEWTKGFLVKNTNIALVFLIAWEDMGSIVVNEASKQKLPLICLTNTDKNIEPMQYPVFCNDKNIESIFFISLLLTKIFESKLNH